MTDKQIEAIQKLKRIDIKYFLSGMMEQSNYIVEKAEEVNNAIGIVLKLLEKQQKEIESTKKEYYSLINRIENKIDYFDYEFEKAKRKNNNDRADYYWDLIRNFKKLLESEE